MRILFNELKKTFRPVVLLLIILVFGMLYIARFEGYPDTFFKTRLGMNFRYEYSCELVERYGKTLEPEEFEGVLADYDEMCRQLGNYISSNETFTSNNVYSYKDYSSFLNADISAMSQAELEAHEQAGSEMFYLLYSDDFDWLVCKINDLEQIIIAYNEYYSPETSTILPSNISELMECEMFGLIFVLLVLCASLVAAPMLVTDNLNGIRPLQYHTRTGVRTLIYQFISTILSVWIVCAVVLGAIFLIFLPTGVFDFWDAPLNSFMQYARWSLYLIDLTLGQRILVLTGFGMLFATGVAMIIFFLAQISNNYISLILKVVPVTVGTCVLGYFAADNAFCMLFDFNTGEPLGKYNLNIIIFTAIVFITGAVLSAFVMIREKKREI